ncbi:cysteine-rich repeat secretory protein 15-like isoform X2 [Papaver somniferum]|nr:cysteine-rich repeat secretory protein 15-like isoform X2 [Papaver somniferum]
MFMELHNHFSSSLGTISLFSLNLSSIFFYFLLSSSVFSLGHINGYMFIYGGCSQDRYPPDSPFEVHLNSLLSSIVSSSSQFSYNAFAIGNSSTPDSDAAYGLYQCRGDLKLHDCTACVQNAVGQINLVCPNSFAAGLQLDGCYVRYENIDFLGKPDTAILYKKCSRSTSDDVEFYKRRDDVLAELQAATSFRVASLGMVEGFAQCLGDLSPSDCSSCLSEAVSKLKNTCGSASAVDIYLGQCYARYWASGYYNSSDSSSEDNVGRTVAIIVGVLAGVAVIIVLLSFLRKALG